MLTIATIGTSVITRSFADAVSRVPDVQIGSVYSRDAARAAAFAAELGVADSESDLAALLADPAIDAIITTGGTGVSGRDVTPAALEPLFQKRMDGFSVLFN